MKNQNATIALVFGFALTPALSIAATTPRPAGPVAAATAAPFPSSSAPVGRVVATQPMLSFGSPDVPVTVTFNVHQTGFTGTFTSSNTCETIGAYPIARILQGGRHAENVLADREYGGTCTITIVGGDGQSNTTTIVLPRREDEPPEPGPTFDPGPTVG